MNINPKIFTASSAELTTYALFHDMVKIMKAADGVEPAGACCGRNTKQIINSFINKKQKYFDFMKNISERRIKPLRKGVVYISPMKKMLNYELMTDLEIISCVRKGYLSDKIFDWTEYNNAQKSVEVEIPVESPTEVETPAESPAEVKTPAVEPIVEKKPEVEPINIDSNQEETPVVETPVKETPVEKPKRSAKRGSK